MEVNNLKEKYLSNKIIAKYSDYLKKEEKTQNTVEKYIRDIKKFKKFLNSQIISKEKVIEYKNYLLSENYAISSINSMIASINSLFSFIGCDEYKVKSIKQQHSIFCPKEKELTEEEYKRLIYTAESIGNHRLKVIIETICGTGIRVSELKYITVESVKLGQVVVMLKGKTRTIFIVRKLQKILLKYAFQQGIRSGEIFVTRNGKSINRTNIWREMKKLCKQACVEPQKVFPHNLRHLFAKIFYSIDKNISMLADILGHSSINTTRLYIISSGIEHRKCMEKMHLII